MNHYTHSVFKWLRSDRHIYINNPAKKCTQYYARRSGVALQLKKGILLPIDNIVEKGLHFNTNM